MSSPSRKILIIDDSELLLAVARGMLERGGYEVVSLVSPREFEVAEVLFREKPRLLLVDVDMPVLQGDRLIDLLNQYGLIGTTKVVLHSAKPVLELAMHAQLCGADGYIEKTSDETDFLREVAAFFDEG